MSAASQFPTITLGQPYAATIRTAAAEYDAHFQTYTAEITVVEALAVQWEGRQTAVLSGNASLSEGECAGMAREYIQHRDQLVGTDGSGGIRAEVTRILAVYERAINGCLETSWTGSSLPLLDGHTIEVLGRLGCDVNAMRTAYVQFETQFKLLKSQQAEFRELAQKLTPTATAPSGAALSKLKLAAEPLAAREASAASVVLSVSNYALGRAPYFTDLVQKERAKMAAPTQPVVPADSPPPTAAASLTYAAVAAGGAAKP